MRGWKGKKMLSVSRRRCRRNPLLSISRNNNGGERSNRVTIDFALMFYPTKWEKRDQHEMSCYVSNTCTWHACLSRSFLYSYPIVIPMNQWMNGKWRVSIIKLWLQLEREREKSSSISESDDEKKKRVLPQNTHVSFCLSLPSLSIVL